jgi:hypothetical protein
VIEENRQQITEICIMLARLLTNMFTINPLIGYSLEMSLTTNLLTNIVKINPSSEDESDDAKKENTIKVNETFIKQKENRKKKKKKIERR